MSAVQILEQLRGRGYKLAPAGDGIRVEPKSALTDEVRDLIRAHKPELLAALSGQASDAGEVSGQMTTHDRLLDLYGGPQDPDQRSCHWLVLLPPREIEEHFQHPVTRAELAKRYPPPGVLIPFVTAADMTSLWSPPAR